MAETRETQSRSGQGQQEKELQRTGAGAAGLSRRSPFDIFGASPFGMMRRMQEEMDRLFGDVWGSRLAWPSVFSEEARADWVPSIEAFQRGNEFVVRADVPGVRKEDLSVEIGEEALTIQGERKYDREEEREGIYRSERGYGSFCRVIPLPQGAMADSAKANFKDGVLEIVIQAPPQEVRRGRRIEIGEGKSEPAKERR